MTVPDSPYIFPWFRTPYFLSLTWVRSTLCTTTLSTRSTKNVSRNLRYCVGKSYVSIETRTCWSNVVLLGGVTKLSLVCRLFPTNGLSPSPTVHMWRTFYILFFFKPRNHHEIQWGRCCENMCQIFERPRTSIRCLKFLKYLQESRCFKWDPSKLCKKSVYIVVTFKPLTHNQIFLHPSNQTSWWSGDRC